MKYVERAFVCSVPHKHFLFEKKHQFCTGETIINPAKINALLKSAVKPSSWYLFNEQWEILKIRWDKSWSLQPNVKSAFFYFIGNRTYLIDLIEALEKNTVKEWLDKYRNEQFILTLPVFTDSQYKDNLWFVSNTYTNKIKRVSLESCHLEKITVNRMIENRSFTIGSSYLLLLALVTNHTVIGINEFRSYMDGYPLEVNIQPQIYPYYLSMGNIPMICDILPECTQSWFTEDEHFRLFPEWNQENTDNLNIMIDYPYIYYFVSKYRLQCLDECPIRDLAPVLIKQLTSNNDTTHPWLYPQWVRLIQETQRGWTLWKKRKTDWIDYIYRSEFQGVLSKWNFAITTLFELSYLYHETPVHRHRVKVIWKECLDYIRRFDEADTILRWTVRKYWVKYSTQVVPALPIYFLNNLNIAELGLLKEMKDDNESRYYLANINKRIVTKLHITNNLPYTIGCLMQYFYKEHKEDLYN